MNYLSKKFTILALLVFLVSTTPAYAIEQTIAGLKNSAAPLDTSKIVFQQVTTGLQDPVFITNAGDSSGRIFVLERTGKIRIIKNGILLKTPFLNIQSSVKSDNSEQGLLALAFHPSYDSNGSFFVVYNATRANDATGSNLILKKFAVSSNPDVANPNSGVTILTVSHPTNSNHNGGGLAFGQDGYLYWSIGDGGSGGDPANNAQNLNRFLGKMLRLDVDSGSPYAIPNTNPFYSSTSTTIKKEIWAYGLRNPWHFSFDSLTHDLYIGDVGQSEREEVDFQPAVDPGGENYGWRVMEGSICYDPSSGCDQSGKTLPVAEYDHTEGCAITGGYVYRGSVFSAMYGHYFYADFCTGRLFSIYRNSTPGWDAVQYVDTGFNITTFGEDEQKELYLADYSSGTIYRIEYQPTSTVSTTFNSNGANDGWVLESSQTSNTGNLMNATSSLIVIGDNSANKQYRGILDFDTSSLPDTAIITAATLNIEKGSVRGTNPFTTHGGLRVDIRTPYFGSGIGLEIGDFQAGASGASIATFSPFPASNWYTATFNYGGTSRISLSNNTQFRLRFALGDNHDNNSDYLKIYSGNAAPIDQPQLTIDYFIP